MNQPLPVRRQAIRACAATLVACLLAACSPDAQKFKSIDITGADYAKGFALADHNGAQRTLADFKGKVVVVFFGFTQCPDVCPTALADLAEVKRLLGPQGDKLQGLFVSVDPERDTPDILQAYVGSFHPSFIGLRTDLPRTTETAAYFKVYFRKVPMGGSYTLDHSVMTYVFDTTGQLRLASLPGQPSARLAADVRQLLAAPH